LEGGTDILTYDENGTLHVGLNHACRMCTVPDNRCFPHNATPPPAATTTILECGPMPNLMVALPNTGGALYSTPQSLADAHY